VTVLDAGALDATLTDRAERAGRVRARWADGLDALAPARTTGTVAGVMGHDVAVRGLRLRVGDTLTLHAESGDRVAEVVAVGPDSASALVYGQTEGLGRGDRVSLRPGGFGAVVSADLVGRVVDAMGRPLDGGPPLVGEPVSVNLAVPPPMARQRIAQPLPVGVRVIDSLCTVGRGQRMGLFGGSGVGKSTLLGMMARGTVADVNVIALIGERGREVREFLEDDLGPEGLARSVVVVATSDQPPLVRLRAGFLATRFAEWFADGGADVLLMFDSLTRMAMAQRDVGLAAGEPPTARGYTPSVFSLLPNLLERAGPRERGTVTGLYTVLVDGDDMNDPIADAARSILDGHIVLDRRLGTMGRYPAVDPLASLSRLAPKVTSTEQRAHARGVRAALAAAEEVRDLVEVGAYVPGTNPLADRGLAAWGDLVGFLAQDMYDRGDWDETWQRLAALAGRVHVEGIR
jgi:flagellum-specific ATP synthase